MESEVSSSHSTHDSGKSRRYDGKFCEQKDESFARSLASNTDDLIFGDESLKLKDKELKDLCSKKD